MKSKNVDVDLDTPISSWSEDDTIDGVVVRSRTIILRTVGCSWFKKAGCTMCGYSNDCPDVPVSDDNLLNQMRRALDRLDDEVYIKIFTSGSFLDEKEISLKAAEGILRLIEDKVPDCRLLIETRPEFVTVERIDDIMKIHDNLEIAIGLEDSSDQVLSSLIRKGFTWSDYCKAAEIITDRGIHLKTYLLLKPPIFGEERSIVSTLSSIRRVHDSFPGSCISINPMNIQYGTEVEHLFSRGLYRPPWLWSVIEVLKRGHEITGGLTRLMSAPTGAGKARGSHNCGKCDKQVMEIISRYSMSGDPEILTFFGGCCLDEWIDHRRISVITSMDIRT